MRTKPIPNIFKEGDRVRRKGNKAISKIHGTVIYIVEKAGVVCVKWDSQTGARSTPLTTVVKIKNTTHV
jgi:hypothetical protein